MATTDEVRKTLTDPTPLYAAVGTADLAAEKLREVPALIERIRAEAPERIEAIRSTDPKAVQQRVTAQAKEAQQTVRTKVSEVLGTLDNDLRKLRETAQGYALQGAGRAAGYAVKARETYDELAERGRHTVQNWRTEPTAPTAELAAPAGAEGPGPVKKTDGPAAAPEQAEDAGPEHGDSKSAE
ncbi:hypothetical protein [Streptomyces sp. TP-A0874]|uniref:hypothetical protein n=1 Tax=Streptomyces sp. TP-A0874 TaxID=549819 RepID=UPI000852D84A|nr:hypothetical protein [Streptomyces sp. TP-A0874]